MIYGAQDMSDDEIIGLKSTSIKFKKNIKMFVFFLYDLNFNLNYFIPKYFRFKLYIFLILFALSLFYQVLGLEKKNIKIPKVI